MPERLRRRWRGEPPLQGIPARAARTKRRARRSRKKWKTNETRITVNKGEGIQSIPVAAGRRRRDREPARRLHGRKRTAPRKKHENQTTVAGSQSRRGHLRRHDQNLQGSGRKTSKSASDKLTCSEPAKAEQTINVVVRLDKSGTTHIFKAFLVQAGTRSPIEMEEANEPRRRRKRRGQPCKAVKPAEETRTWAQVAEGCENQRWPEAAEIVRPAGKPVTRA